MPRAKPQSPRKAADFILTQEEAAQLDVDALPPITAAEQTFVAQLLGGANAIDAYRKAYPSRAKRNKPETLWNQASDLKRSDRVQAWLAAHRRAGLATGILSLEQHVADLAEAAQMARDKGHTAALVQAITAQGKAMGLYEERLTLTQSTSDSDLVRLIRELGGDDLASEISKLLGIASKSAAADDTVH